MRVRTQIVISIVCLVVAAAVGLGLYTAFSRMVTIAQVVTPAVTIPAGALIEGWMLTTREVPRPLLTEDIYTSAEELAGRVAVTVLRPGMVVYRPFAVSPSEFRLVEDPALTVVSFPVDPARAVGGQIQPGHRVDVWRLVAVRPSATSPLPEILSGQWATATLLVEGVPVVDVRAAGGGAVARQPQAVPGQVDTGDSARSTSSQPSLQVLTVAVPPQVAQEILSLVAQERAGAELWVSLSPLVREDSPAPTPTVGVDPVPLAEPSAVPSPTPGPVATPPPSPSPTPPSASVHGTGGERLLVRESPDGQIVGSLPEGTRVTVLGDPMPVDGVDWLRIQCDELSGWVVGSYLTFGGDE